MNPADANDMSTLGTIDRVIGTLSSHRDDHAMNGPHWQSEPGHWGLYCMSGDRAVPREECERHYEVIKFFDEKIRRLEQQKEIVIQTQKPASK